MRDLVVSLGTVLKLVGMPGELVVPASAGVRSWLILAALAELKPQSRSRFAMMKCELDGDRAVNLKRVHALRSTHATIGGKI